MAHPASHSRTTEGAAESNPTTSNIPASRGSAIENPVAVIPTTTSRADRPDQSRYSRSAWNGCTSPNQVSLSVNTTNTSTLARFSFAQTIGKAQSVALKFIPSVSRAASDQPIRECKPKGSNRCENAIGKTEASVRNDTKANAAAAARGVNGEPATEPWDIDPDTSTATR